MAKQLSRILMPFLLGCAGIQGVALICGFLSSKLEERPTFTFSPMPVYQMGEMVLEGFVFALALLGIGLLGLVMHGIYKLARDANA